MEELKSLWEWVGRNIDAIGASLVGSALLAILIAFGRWLWKRRQGVSPPPIPPAPGFPFEIVRSIEDMAAKAPNFDPQELNIPYQHRLPEPEQTRLFTILDESRFLLLRGRTGLGKTREALELARRLQGRFATPLTILVPKSPLTPPPYQWPQGVDSRHILLYLDNLHDHFFGPAEGGEGHTLAGDFRSWLPAAVDHFLAHFPGADFRVIAIVRDDILDPRTGATWDKKLGYSPAHPFWGKFTPYALPDWKLAQQPALITACAAWRGVQVEPGAAQALAARTQGTAAAIVGPFRQKSPGDSLSLKEAQQCPASPEDQAETDWKSLIAPLPQRRYLFQAFSLLKQGGVTPYPDLTVAVAARLWGKPYFYRRRQLRRSLSQVDTWLKPKGPALDCPEEYYRGRASLIDGSRLLTRALLAFPRSHLPRLAPELGSLANALWELPRGNRKENLEQAIACYERALKVYTPEAFPDYHSLVQGNLEEAQKAQRELR